MTTSRPDLRDNNNEVFLRGRLAAEPVVRVMPSGDEICSFRLIVSRAPGARRPVDSLECSTTRPRVRRSLERAVPGDELEITGRLHRNFWRSPTGPASRYEVEVGSVRVSSRRRNGA